MKQAFKDKGVLGFFKSSVKEKTSEAKADLKPSCVSEPYIKPRVEDSRAQKSMVADVCLEQGRPCDFGPRLNTGCRPNSSSSNGGRRTKWNMEQPAEFHCPISKQLMADPVIVASGQSYERACIEAWFESGRRDCLQTGNMLDNICMFPNNSLKTTILNWCEMYNVPKPKPVELEAARKFVQDIINPPKLISPVRYVVSEVGTNLRSEDYFMAKSSVPVILDTSPRAHLGQEQNDPNAPSIRSEGITNLVEELKSGDENLQKNAAEFIRMVARDISDNRIALCTTEILDSLLPLVHSRNSEVQTNSMAAVLNLSLEKENKLKVARAAFIPSLVNLLKSENKEVQEHAAGTIFSLALHEDNRIPLGVLGAVPPLVQVLKNGSSRAQQDAAMALYYLSLAQLNRSKLVKAGLIPILFEIAKESQGNDLATRAMCILSCLAAGQEGRTAVLELNGISVLLGFLAKTSEGNDLEFKEHAIATLLHLSNHNIRFKPLARQAGAVDILVSLLETATPRGKDKVNTLLNILKDVPNGNSPSSPNFEPHYQRAYIRRGPNWPEKAETSRF